MAYKLRYVHIRVQFLNVKTVSESCHSCFSKTVLKGSEASSLILIWKLRVKGRHSVLVCSADVSTALVHSRHMAPVSRPSDVSVAAFTKTSHELRMLSSVTLNCQETKIVMHAGSQLSEL